MSLLMKALEKAAKDRETAVPAGAETQPAVDLGMLAGAAAATPAAAAAEPRTSATTADAAKSEFTLEPIAAPVKPRTAPVSPPPVPAPAPRPATAAAPASASRESALAATVVRAGERDTGGGLGNAVAYMREHLIVVFGPIAALFLIGYGIYIYLQMTGPAPATLAKQAPRPAPPPPAAPAATAPSGVLPPAAAVSGGTTAASLRPIPLAAVLSPTPEGAAREGTVGAPAAPAPASRSPASAQAAAPEPALTPAPAAAAAPAVRDTIKVLSGGAAPVVNPLLAEAYAALNARNFESASRLYNQLLRSEPNNADALLALAAIATEQSDGALATRHYLKVLEIEPRNALAQAGLIGMLGRADPLAAESRLKQLIARDPSAYLYFTLGNIYADQNRWPDAQQAYYQAHHLQSGNPDYAYNLAVGLEHVGQPKLALEYYRRALQLVAAKGSTNFSTAAVQARIGKLEKIVQ